VHREIPPRVFSGLGEEMAFGVRVMKGVGKVNQYSNKALVQFAVVNFRDCAPNQATY
jgi:hypothetical protein